MISFLRNGGTGPLIKEFDLEVVKRVLPVRCKTLGGLKAVGPEAYFYWALAFGTSG